jgi:hypothetical protein
MRKFRLIVDYYVLSFSLWAGWLWDFPQSRWQINKVRVSLRRQIRAA